VAPERLLRVAGLVLAARSDAHVVLVGDGPLRADVDPRHLPAGTAARFHHLPTTSDGPARWTTAVAPASATVRFVQGSRMVTAARTTGSATAGAEQVDRRSLGQAEQQVGLTDLAPTAVAVGGERRDPGRGDHPGEA